MIPHKAIPHDTSIMKAALTLAILALTINGALCLKHGADDVDNLDNILNENKLVEILPRHRRDLYNLSDFIAEDPIQIAKLREQALAADRSSEGTTEWEPILYKFGTTLHSSEVGRMSTWYKEISDFVQAYRYNRNRRTTPDTRPENPDDTWTLSRPKFKGDFVGKPFHDPPWRLDQLKYLHCHIDDCKAWFEKSDYRSYVLHMYDHFFNHRNFYVTWHPQQTKQNFTCYNKSCHEVFEEPGDFFSHVHEHLIEEKVTDRTLFTTERTIPVADFFSNKPTTTPKPYLKQSCYMCGKIYYTKESLDKHLIWHAFNGSFYFTAKRLTLPPPHCVPCELQFSTEDKLVKHREKIHPQPGVHLKMFKEYYGHDTRNNPDPMGFFCPMCPKRYFLPFNMEKHIAWHGQHSPHDEILPIGRPRKAFILFGNTLADEHTTKAEKIFHDPPRIAALLAQCRKELDEIDVNYTTPAYPQPEYVNVDSDLTSEREDSRTQEHKIPLTEEIMDLDPNGSRYLEAMLRKPPKFCKKCHYITNDTLEFNRHYREHCWEVALFKHRKRSEIYDRMDALYEEADRIRKKEWNQGLLQNPQADFRIRERRSVTDQNELDEKTKRELDEIREGLSKIAAEELQPRERRDLSAKESAEFIDALSRELLERRKREVDFDRIQMEIRREMFTVPYQMGQKCESCNDTNFMDKAAYVLHLKEHIGNQSFFEQGWKDPPTPYRSLEFTGYPTAKQRNGSEEARYRAVGRDIISEFQDFEIARRRGVDNRTYEQFRRDRAIELGLKFGLLRTRQTTLPPPPPKPSSAEVNARLNAKLNDVKAKLKAYQDRKTKGQTGNITDASKEIENKIEDLKRKMDEIKQKYNATKKRARRSPMGAKIPKDRLKNQFMAEMKQKEKMAKKKGITMDNKKTDFDFFGGENILDRTTAGKGKPKRRGRRELKEDIKRDFEAIKNNTFLEMWDKDINDVISTRKPKPKPSPKTTETPFPDYVDFENGTTISLLEGLKLMKSKINVVLERYRQIHNLKGVTWNMELLKKYNMLEPLEEIKNKTAELNKTEIVRRIAEFEYFDQWEPDQTTQAPTTLSDAELKQKKEHEKYMEGLAHKFQALKVELHSVIMKHFTGDELEKMDPGVKRKIEGLVKMTNETGPLLKRQKRDVETTTWVFTPRPYFERCSQCSVNFTRKTEYYQHEFQHILNEDFLAQAEATLNADQKYEQWKAERDNSTTPYAIDLLLSKKTIPMFNDSNDEAAIKQYFITKMQENYAYGNRHKIKADMAMRKATSPIIDLDAFTFEPINRTEVVEVFNRVSLYYARQDQEQRERELKEREAQEGAKPARRRRHVGQRRHRRLPNIVNRRSGRHFNKIYLLDEFQNKISRVRFEIEEIRFRYKKTLAEYLRERNLQAYKRRRRDLVNVEKSIQENKPGKICDKSGERFMNTLDQIVNGLKIIKHIKPKRTFRNEMEEIDKTNYLVVALHKYLRKLTNERESVKREMDIARTIVQNQKEHKIEKFCNLKNYYDDDDDDYDDEDEDDDDDDDDDDDVDDDYDYIWQMGTKLRPACTPKDREHCNHVKFERNNQKNRKTLFLQNKLNENILTWLNTIRDNNEAVDKIINTRKVKKRVKRFRTLSQMDTHEFRESNDKILDSVSLQIPCEYCGLVFPSTEILYDHMRTRHDARFRRDYLKGKFTETEEREMTKTEDPIKQIEEGKIDYKKLFNKRRKREINVTDTPAPYIITTRFKLYATPKYSWGSDPYPEYSISMDPATFDQNNMSHKFSNEIHECWYCKQNLSNYALLLKHAEKEHQDFTSDPDQSLLGTEYYGRKRGRATRRRRTKRFNPNRTVRSTKFTRRTKARTIKTTIRDENWNSDRELDSSEWYEGKTKHMRYKNEDSLDSKGNPVNMSNYIHF